VSGLKLFRWDEDFAVADGQHLRPRLFNPQVVGSSPTGPTLHPESETPGYSAVYENTQDPRHGQRLLHIVLRPKGRGDAK
jgi:hypothetical protein